MVRHLEGVRRAHHILIVEPPYVSTGGNIPWRQESSALRPIRIAALATRKEPDHVRNPLWRQDIRQHDVALVLQSPAGIVEHGFRGRGKPRKPRGNGARL